MAAPAATARFRVSVDCGYPASLYYLLDNMAGGSFRASAYYRSFWVGRFGPSRKDEAALSRYAALREKVPESDWSLLFVGAASLDDAKAKAASRLKPADAAALGRVLRRFDARFRPVYDADAPGLCRAANGLRAPEMAEKVAGFLGRAADFFELPAGATRDYSLAILWHPGLKVSAGLMHGRRLGPVMLVELPPGQGFEEQIDVAVHEFIHDLFAAVPKPLFAETAASVMKADPRSGLFFLEGMNEGLATAFGQGLFIARNFPEQFHPDGSWYATSVDAFAKAIEPELAKALDGGGTLRSSAVVLASKVAPLAAKAKLTGFLGSHALMTDKSTGPLTERLFEAVNATDVNGYDAAELAAFRKTLDERPERPAVVMLLPRSLKAPLTKVLEEAFPPALLTKAKRAAVARPLALAGKSPSGRVFLLLLGSRAGLEDGLLRLGALEFPGDAPVVRSLADGSPVAL